MDGEHLIRLSGGDGLWAWACLRSTGFPASLWLDLRDTRVVDAARACLDDDAAAWERLGQALAEHWEQTEHALAAMPQLDELAAALLWQNPRFHDLALVPLLEHRYRPGSSKHRQKLVAVLAYLQRYTMKNDSIGFFGPIGWLPIDPMAPVLVEARPGDGLVSRATVYHEAWAVQSLADALLSDQRLRRHVAPRLVPHLRVDGDALRLPFGATAPLTPGDRALLEACTGRRPAGEIAAALTTGPRAPFGSAGEVYERLATLHAERRVEWSLDPGPTMEPEERLLELLGKLAADDEPGASEALATVRRYCGLVDGLAGVARDPRALRPALQDVAEAFAEATGEGSYRRAGEAYAARTPAALDCRRDVRGVVGRGFVELIDEPLSLVLRSAWWLLAKIRSYYERLLLARHPELARGEELELVDLWLGDVDLWFAEDDGFLDPLVGELIRRWARLLPYEGATGPVEVTARDIAAEVERAFPLPPGAVPAGAYCSPDVMLCGGPELDAAGAYAVLGELHLARNTLATQCFMQQHPSIGALRAAWEHDHRGERPVVLMGDQDATTGRTRPGLVVERQTEVRIAARSPARRSDARDLSDYAVRAGEAGLTARCRRDGTTVGLLDLLHDAVTESAISAFRIVAKGAHRPRVAIDRLVVHREAWTVPFADLEPLFGKTPERRFVAARRLARDLGLPRLVFLAYAARKKPLFVDLDSPCSVELAIRQARGHADPDGSVTFSEMLPPPEELWLADRQGRRYTSELRLGVRFGGRDGLAPG